MQAPVQGRHGQYVSNSPAELPMSSVKEQTLLWQGVGQPGYIGGDSGIHSGATTQVGNIQRPLRKVNLPFYFSLYRLLLYLEKEMMIWILQMQV